MRLQRLLLTLWLAYFLYFLITVAVFVGVAYTAIHFISKYW